MNKAYALPAIALALICAGCNPPDPAVPLPPPQIERTPLKRLIPKSAFQCLSEPDGAQVESNADGADYIADLKIAGADCRRKLGFLSRQIQNEAE